MDVSAEPAQARQPYAHAGRQAAALLGAVFGELSRYLSDAYSSSLLLQSAQRLIDIAEGKHRETAIRDPPTRSDYFSRNVASAVRSDPWTIACREQLQMTQFDDLLPEAAQRIRQILQDQLD